MLGAGTKLDGAIGVVIAVHRQAADAFAVSVAFVLVPVLLTIMVVHYASPL
jgi:hypothetical protein